MVEHRTFSYLNATNAENEAQHLYAASHCSHPSPLIHLSLFASWPASSPCCAAEEHRRRVIWTLSRIKQGHFM